MRYGLLSCVHANLPALEAVLRDSEKARCDTLLCLGDIVGYLDHPKECLELVRSRCSGWVKGNWDEYCSGTGSLENFPPSTTESIEWTRAELSPADKAWLAGLSLRLDVADFTIVHATLHEPSHWEYIFTDVSAASHFEKQDSPLCFFGHTHMPMVYRQRNRTTQGDMFTRFELRFGYKYLVNVGSVGQPRDGNPDSGYAIYDQEARTVELRQVPYPRPPTGSQGTAKPVPGTGGPAGGLQTRSNLTDG